MLPWLQRVGLALGGGKDHAVRERSVELKLSSFDGAFKTEMKFTFSKQEMLLAIFVEKTYSLCCTIVHRPIMHTISIRSLQNFEEYRATKKSLCNCFLLELSCHIFGGVFGHGHPV